MLYNLSHSGSESGRDTLLLRLWYVMFMPNVTLYRCSLETVICEVCEKTRKCPGCTLGQGALKRVYFFFKDEDEQDRAVNKHLEGTYLYASLCWSDTRY